MEFYCHASNTFHEIRKQSLSFTQTRFTPGSIPAIRNWYVSPYFKSDICIHSRKTLISRTNTKSAPSPERIAQTGWPQQWPAQGPGATSTAGRRLLMTASGRCERPTKYFVIQQKRDTYFGILSHCFSPVQETCSGFSSSVFYSNP